MNGRLATVFGGSGFVGRHVVRRLARAGWRVRVAVRRPNTAGFLRTMGLVGQVELVKCDIRDGAAVSRALEGADAAVNLVGILFESGRQRFQTLQAEAPGTIARAAVEAGVRQFVQMSAIGADAESDARYARSKAAGEAAAQAAFPGAVILRPSIVFGPEDQFYNRFAALLSVLPAFPLFGGGRTRFQPVYVDDVADAVLRVIETPDHVGRIFELGGPNIYTFREILEFIARTIGRKRVFVPVPFWIARLQGAVLGLLPNPPLTGDQVKLLARDNVVSSDPGIGTFADLGIVPEAPEALVEAYLWRFRPEGQFHENGTA